MKLKKIILALAGAAMLLAQDSVQKVIQLKHVSPDSLRAILDTVAGNRARWNTDRSLRVVVVNGPPDLVETVEAIVRKYDVPPPTEKNVELIFHLLLANQQAESGSIPAELNAVVAQLKNVFGIKSVRVLETAIMRVREGRGSEVTGLMAPAAKVDINAHYSLKVQNISITGEEKAARIRLDQIRMHLRLPTQVGPGNTQFNDSNLSTDVDIREGQKVVVGKMSVDSGAQSIFLVVSAKVVE